MQKLKPQEHAGLPDHECVCEDWYTSVQIIFMCTHTLIYASVYTMDSSDILRMPCTSTGFLNMLTLSSAHQWSKFVTMCFIVNLKINKSWERHLISSILTIPDHILECEFLLL